MNSTVSVTSRQQRKTNWLPLLVFLFVLCWGSLTSLVVLQDRMIDAQADVIHALFKENHLKAMLSARKPQAPAAERRSDGTRDQTSSKDKDRPVSGPAASDQVRSKESSERIPSTQGKRQNNAKADRNHNAGKRSPFSHPPAEMTDPSDMRRTLLSI